MTLLAAEPECGAIVFANDRQLSGMRRFPISGSFERVLIFYFPLADGIDVVRVIHGSRDLETAIPLKAQRQSVDNNYNEINGQANRRSHYTCPQNPERHSD